MQEQITSSKNTLSNAIISAEQRAVSTAKDVRRTILGLVGSAFDSGLTTLSADQETSTQVSKVQSQLVSAFEQGMQRDPILGSVCACCRSCVFDTSAVNAPLNSAVESLATQATNTNASLSHRISTLESIVALRPCTTRVQACASTLDALSVFTSRVLLSLPPSNSISASHLQRCCPGRFVGPRLLHDLSRCV